MACHCHRFPRYWPQSGATYKCLDKASELTSKRTSSCTIWNNEQVSPPGNDDLVRTADVCDERLSINITTQCSRTGIGMSNKGRRISISWCGRVKRLNTSVWTRPRSTSDSSVTLSGQGSTRVPYRSICKSFEVCSRSSPVLNTGIIRRCDYGSGTCPSQPRWAFSTAN